LDQRIDLLKHKDQKVIAQVYEEYRNGFFLFARRYPLDDSKILDVYQDAIVALCENAQKGLLDSLTGSLKTYLFSIGKYMIYSEIKKQGKNVNFEEIQNILPEWEEYSEDELNENIKKLREGFAGLGEKCREILKLFYYEEKNLDEITDLMQYDNKDVTKSQKSRCLRQLKQIIKDKNG